MTDNELTAQLNFENLLFELSKKYQLPDNFKLRRLNFDDYEKGYIELLSQLTSTGSITYEEFKNRLKLMINSKMIFIAVIEDLCTKKIVGSATLFLEWKFIHKCGTRGRIEDVVIDKEYRNKSFGKILNSILVEIGRNHFNVYKLSLECKDSLSPFYEKFGYKKDNNNFLVQRFCD